MPLTDAGNKFSKNQAGYRSTQLDPTLEGELVTATAFLSGVIDRLSASDSGAGEAIYPFAKVTNNAAFNPGTSADFQVIGADNLAMTTNPVVLSDSGTILATALGAGAMVVMPPLTTGIRKRYIGLKVTVAGGSATTGAIVSGLVDKNGRAQLYLQTTGTPAGHNQ